MVPPSGPARHFIGQCQNPGQAAARLAERVVLRVTAINFHTRPPHLQPQVQRLSFDCHRSRSNSSSRVFFSSSSFNSKNMTVPSATSPPVSPPAKRVKTDSDARAPTTTTNTAAAVETLPAPTATAMEEQMTPLLIKKLSEKAKLPTRGSAFAAGYDLYAARDTVVPARGKILVDTDISMAVPAGTYGRIAPRSGLASKHFIDTGAGVIDADYRGQVKVLLFNHAEKDFEVKEGDRIAQLVLEKIYTPEVLEVQELEESVRGAGGFGSTG